jgi:hypothetical protein
LSARDQTDRTDLNQLRVASRPGSGLQNRSNGSHTLLRDVGKQEFGEFAWMGERNQVATWDFVNGLAEPLVCHARLKVTRKEPIVFTNYHVNRNVGPRLEVRGLAEGDLGFLALVRGSFFGDILWHIMEEIRGEIELDAVATTLGRSLPRFEPSSVIPPLTGRFAGKRDHAFTKASMRIGVRARVHTSAAVNAPIDWATSVTSFRFPIEATTRSA